MELVLFNIFINDLADGTEPSHSKFSGNSELKRLSGTLKGCGAIQQDLDRLEK